ncbi:MULTISPECIES: ribosomal-processing cysteine protease Prp [Breznakia]|uniref:Ribosomal processing cysteine protease Prp n=1 Tax=Breznakia blatticola TaxID=1754012 RepID=A0A4V3G6G8_9FIRM|nr:MULTISPECIES: ribosomal-processing cysteine protease Prp [Breznakia]MDH6366763.1 uncharacterized protein YsxB (DUF464 family) [Breznakia sp. PH1-1]MDH6403850.1 uncharacterized protein YsxB (DUF464 family) [Breznakia sp. PF1-11]MDH6411559.1 uncharacterized protein YsxB (DUF464 family) [Breznakia sp. PFB1-11]MDH6413923.1 uncharacterized protein YsxB (DUF464 family) [Breznakia sp. PFB1-14]MDH6416352.1 uncharacterized protein YsxB (DUF464 family) [Breznakia sp. PFB1-4]
MVKVKIDTKADQITQVVIKGHADSAEHGQDLVCAGVSSIAVGILNTLHVMDENACSLEMNDAFIKIVVINNTETVQTVLKTLYIQLKTMVENYSAYIQITKEEV